MSRDIIAVDTYGGYDNNWPGGVTFNNNQIYIYGRANNGDIMWNNWFVGDGIKFDPKSNSTLGTILVTEEEPFGYTVIRYTTSIDSRFDNGYTGSYQNGYIGIWLVEDNGATAQGDRWNNFIYFYDKSSYTPSLNDFGYFYNVENGISMASLTTDIDGISVGNLTTDFRRTMDDNQAGFNNSMTYGSSYFNAVTQPLGIKLTTDGKKARIYINPNPTGSSGTLSNSWILIAEKDAYLVNDIVAYLSAETPFFRTEAIETRFDDFLIRSVSSNITAYITPQNVLTNSIVTFTLWITNRMGSTNESGIGEILIKRPVSFTNSNWILDSVSVSNQYGNLSRSIGNFNPNVNYFSVTNKGVEYLYIRFRMTSASDHQIVTNNLSVIKITFDMWTPSTINASGESFEVYADCSKHFDTGPDWVANKTTGIKYATTGMKKAYQAFNNALLVKSFGVQKAYAKVEYSPLPLTIANNEADFRLKLSTIGIYNNPDISYLRVKIPTGFIVSNNTGGFTNILS